MSADAPIKVNAGTSIPSSYSPPVAKSQDGTLPGDAAEGLGQRLAQKMPKIVQEANEGATPSSNTASEGAKTLSQTKPGIAAAKGSMAGRVSESLGGVTGHPNLGIDGKHPIGPNESQTTPPERLKEVATATRMVQSAKGEEISPPPTQATKQAVQSGETLNYDALEGRSRPKHAEQDEESQLAPTQQGPVK